VTDGSLFFVSPTSPAHNTFELATLKVLLNISGSMKRPVKEVIFAGLGFTGSLTTFLEPHGVPSGGDLFCLLSSNVFV
jgi:hypothetical protein